AARGARHGDGNHEKVSADGSQHKYNRIRCSEGTHLPRNRHLMSLCEILMSRMLHIDRMMWDSPSDDATSAAALTALEDGDVVFMPELRVAIERAEAALFPTAILGRAKNASFDPSTGRLGGTSASGRDG